MEGYSSEEQQVEAIKKWWLKNGKSVITGILLGVTAVMGVRWWTAHKSTRAEAAAAAYEAMLDDMGKNNVAAVKQRAANLEKEYDDTPYSVLAALAQAKMAVEQGDHAGARTQLEWAIAHTKDPALAEVARMRLARVLLDAKQPAETLKALAASTGAGFAAERAELRGDALRAQNQNDKAVVAYREALHALKPEQAAHSERLQMKLDDLGVAEESH